MTLRVTPEMIRAVLSYCPQTGKLTWRTSRGGALAGSEAGPRTYCHGYARVSVYGKQYQAHRLAWAIHTGKWPRHVIDHVNGDTADNRIANLREATRSQNNANSRRRKDNTSGAVGVHYYARTGKWTAHIRVRGRLAHLGYFDSPEAASTARDRAAVEMFGAFASTNLKRREARA